MLWATPYRLAFPPLSGTSVQVLMAEKSKTEVLYAIPNAGVAEEAVTRASRSFKFATIWFHNPFVNAWLVATSDMVVYAAWAAESATTVKKKANQAFMELRRFPFFDIFPRDKGKRLVVKKLSS